MSTATRRIANRLVPEIAERVAALDWQRGPANGGRGFAVPVGEE